MRMPRWVLTGLWGTILLCAFGTLLGHRLLTSPHVTWKRLLAALEAGDSKTVSKLDPEHRLSLDDSTGVRRLRLDLSRGDGERCLTIDLDNARAFVLVPMGSGWFDTEALLYYELPIGGSVLVLEIRRGGAYVERTLIFGPNRHPNDEGRDGSPEPNP